MIVLHALVIIVNVAGIFGVIRKGLNGGCQNIWCKWTAYLAITYSAIFFILLYLLGTQSISTVVLGAFSVKLWVTVFISPPPKELKEHKIHKKLEQEVVDQLNIRHQYGREQHGY